MASENSNLDEEKAEKSPHKQGGWITFPFLSGSILGVGLAMHGVMSNFLVYLIQEYNVRSIDAAQIVNIINGSVSLAPVAGAIVADAFIGCYSVIAISSGIQLLSLVLFMMTAALKSLQPTPCDIPGTDSCQAASKGQLTVLYSAVALLAIATGGTRFNQATMGASQFNRVEDQAVYFNWFFIFMYISLIVGATAIVYIQDSISWVMGFGLSLGTSAVSLIVLLLGTKYYHRPAPRGSPFTGLFRVVVATVRKWKVKLSQATPSYFHGNDGMASPSQSFSIVLALLFKRCMRKFYSVNIFTGLALADLDAALTGEDETNQDGSIAKPWKLCTVQEVEDFKSVVRVLPVWTSSIFISISIGCQMNLSVLQALTMDRSIGPSFSIPAGSMTVPASLAFVIFLTFLDRILFPIWHKLTHHTPTPLQRIGIGHLINAVSMIVSALVERRRAVVISRHQAEVHPGWIVPMSALWLVLPLALAGCGEALHFPDQVALCYQEFPKALKNTSTGMVAMIIALGFYLSTVFLSIIRHVTTWLPDDLNRSRLENVYWLIAILSTINFGIYIICAKFYKYQNSVDTEKVAVSEISAS